LNKNRKKKSRHHIAKVNIENKGVMKMIRHLKICNIYITLILQTLLLPEISASHTSSNGDILGTTSDFGKDLRKNIQSSPGPPINRVGIQKRKAILSSPIRRPLKALGSPPILSLNNPEPNIISELFRKKMRRDYKVKCEKLEQYMDSISLTSLYGKFRGM